MAGLTRNQVRKRLRSLSMNTLHGFVEDYRDLEETKRGITDYFEFVVDIADMSREDDELDNWIHLTYTLVLEEILRRLNVLDENLRPH